MAGRWPVPVWSKVLREGVNVAVICLGWDVVTGDVMCCFVVDVAV
ncbi:hypothetical protein XFLM_05835 [Xylella fastidiosa subsp. fastidiosa GB514]|nr:hypothetical protein XFLM_05835 [Xylella fastidiosa subsp. fastidiosa GB514]